MPGLIRYRGKPLRHPRTGRPLKPPGGNLVAPDAPGNEEPPPVQTEWPASPHLRLLSAHGHSTVQGQDGRLANVRLTTPSYPYSQLFTVSIHNTGATPSKQLYWQNQYGGLFQTWGGSTFGALGITREVTSRDWGTYPNRIYAELTNGTVITLDVTVSIADTATGPVLPSVEPTYPVEGGFLEEFQPNTGAGALWLTFGEPQNAGNGVLVLDGARTAMMPPHPQGLNTPQHGLGEGLFEFKARFFGGRGDGTGPALVLWPANDQWPSIDETRIGEIDIGEFWQTRNSLGFWEMYFAVHWMNAAGQNEDDLWNVVPEGAATQTHDPETWNIYGCDARSGYVDFYINGRRVAHYTTRGAPDWARGGVNRCMGVMNASSNTRVECDWARWTAADRITAGYPGTVPYVLPIPGPQDAPEEIEPPGDPVADVLAAQTFLSGLSIGVNIERGRVWSMQYNGQSLKDSLDFFRNLRASGFTHVRLFYPYRPTVNMMDGVWGNIRPTAAQIDRIVDACVTAVKAGMKVFVDALDIIGLEDLTSQYLPLLQAHIDLFCDRILLRTELTPDKIAVGPVNEWASANNAGDNALYNTQRVAFDTRVANKLPNHVRVTGAAGYTSKEQLVASDWAAPTANKRWLAQFHAYESSAGTASFWAGWAQQFAAFSARNGGNPVYCGEAGLWSANDGAYRPVEWNANILNIAQGAPLTRPTYWTITDSANGFMMNTSGSDATIRAALTQSLSNANVLIRSSSGFIAGDDKPGTPPPGPVNSGEPTWDGAVEVFHHTFPGTSLDRGVWPIVYGGPGNGGVFDWDGSCILVNNGLTIETKYVGGRWKAGGMSMGNTVYPGYQGFFAPTQVSFRARADAGRGYGIGLILWPADDVWTQEIDVAESPDADKQRVWMTVHGNPPATVQDSAPHVVDMTQWHVYTARWETGGIRFYIDGNLVRTVTGSQYMPLKNMTIGIQSWVAADDDAWFGGGPQLPAPPPPNRAVNAVYKGHFKSEIQNFESWIGRPVEAVHGYTGRDGRNPDGTLDWDAPDPGWQCDDNEYLGGTGRHIVWSIPITPEDATLAEYGQVADGQQYARHQRWAQRILAHRLRVDPTDTGPIYVRTTWELGGEWFYWTGYAQQDKPLFTEAWRQFALAFKGVSPRIRMVWDIVPDRPAFGVENYYPGDDVVDVIGQDVYWQTEYDSADPDEAFTSSVSENPRGLDWVAVFAAQHGKRIGIPEWGVPGANGNTFNGARWIQRMREWIETHDVAFANYWDAPLNSAYDGLLSDGDPPGTAAALRQLFQTGYGGSVTGGGPDTSGTKRIQVSYVRRLIKP